MIWDTPAIVGFAVQGGFPRAGLVDAVAVALAASGGDAGLVDTPLFGGLPTTVGLWQVPVSDRIGFSVDDLLHPATNARAAFLLWSEPGGSWAWSPAWYGLGWADALDRAADAVVSRRRTQKAPTLGAQQSLEGPVRRVREETRWTVEQLHGWARILRDRTPR